VVRIADHGFVTEPIVSTVMPTAAAEPVPQRVAVPARPYDRLRMWLGLLVSMVVCAAPMVVNLGGAQVTPGDEASTLLMSRETWQRHQAGQKLAWALPSANGKLFIDRPPMPVWVNLAAWWGLDAGRADADALAMRARLASAVMAMLTLMATYWAGMSVGGARVALLATLAAGTTLLLIEQSRWANVDSVFTATTTLSIAAGLWAIRPLKPINWVGRRVSGWLIAGLALAAAILTRGPAAFVFVLPPLIAAVALTPLRRLSNALGLSFALALGVAGAAPWYLYIAEKLPDAWQTLVQQFRPPDELLVLSWSHSRSLLLLSPWSIWVIGALFQPFVRATGLLRRQLLIAWFWFVLLFLLTSGQTGRHPNLLLPLIPAAALMVAQLWGYHIELAGERRVDPGVNILRWPHWASIALLSVLAPLFIRLQPDLVERGLLGGVELPDVPWSVTLGLGAALLLITLLGARWHRQWQPRWAMWATVAWMLTASTLGFHFFARSHQHAYQHLADVRRLSDVAGKQELVYLYESPADRELDEAFLFYLGRIVRPVLDSQVLAPATPAKPPLVIIRSDPRQVERLTRAGYEPVLEFSDSRVNHRQLFRLMPTVP
jgi:4-amino-4-deoxy-L-arabinose transferase-like glycosyltransferase